jgi:hypothetical protein
MSERQQQQLNFMQYNKINNGGAGLLNAPPTDNEDEDYPPQFTSLMHDQETKCKIK